MLAEDFGGCFVGAQAAVVRVAKVAVAGPFGEFDLAYELRFKPLHLGHLLGGHAFTPMALLARGQIREGARRWIDGFTDAWIIASAESGWLARETQGLHELHEFAAGMRMDPNVSLPSAALHKPAATATAEPPLDPPGV